MTATGIASLSNLLYLALFIETDLNNVDVGVCICVCVLCMCVSSYMCAGECVFVCFWWWSETFYKS